MLCQSINIPHGVLCYQPLAAHPWLRTRGAADWRSCSQRSPGVLSGYAGGLTKHWIDNLCFAISPWLRTPDYVRGGQLIGKVLLTGWSLCNRLMSIFVRSRRVPQDFVPLVLCKGGTPRKIDKALVGFAISVADSISKKVDIATLCAARGRRIDKALRAREGGS